MQDLVSSGGVGAGAGILGFDALAGSAEELPARCVGSAEHLGDVGVGVGEHVVEEEHGALVGASDHVTTKSLYAQDPDGLEFEVCWILPASVLTDELTAAARAGARPLPLDLEAEIARFGADTPGGIGVSIPG